MTYIELVLGEEGGSECLEAVGKSEDVSVEVDVMLLAECSEAQCVYHLADQLIAVL